MKLASFRVRDFRSIRDSGDVSLAVARTAGGEERSVTALVGRNESGKSNLLLALATLNPPDGRKPLTMIKDFPRDRHSSEWDEDFEFLSTTWRLDETERRELASISAEFGAVTDATVVRSYAGDVYVRIDAAAPAFDVDEHAKRMRKVTPS